MTSYWARWCLTIVYSTVCSSADQSKHKNSASLAFVWGIHRSPVNSPHREPVTRKSFHLMTSSCWQTYTCQELVWLWRCVGWYDTVFLSCLVWNVYFNGIVQNSLYRDMDIGNMWCPSVHKFHIYSELNEKLMLSVRSPSVHAIRNVFWRSCLENLSRRSSGYGHQLPTQSLKHLLACRLKVTLYSRRIWAH